MTAKALPCMDVTPVLLDSRNATTTWHSIMTPTPAKDMQQASADSAVCNNVGALRDASIFPMFPSLTRPMHVQITCKEGGNFLSSGKLDFFGHTACMDATAAD